MAVTKAAFEALAKKPYTITTLDVPALGGPVGVAQLKGRELDALFAWANRQQEAEQRKAKADGRRPRQLTMRSRLLVRTLVPPPADGEVVTVLTRLLDDTDIALLDEIPVRDLKPLLDEAQRLNYLKDDDLKDDDPALEPADEPETAEV